MKEKGAFRKDRKTLRWPIPEVRSPVVLFANPAHNDTAQQRQSGQRAPR